LASVDVIGVRPPFAEPGPGDVQCGVVVIVPERSGKDFAPGFVMLDIAQGPFMATAYRTALIVALERFFGRSRFSARIWRSPNTARKSGRASAQAKR
jgi:hypothetical protein